ncbi:MAG TPA: TonB family protein [Terriglobales bacterium]|jgi:TonB family protein
MSATATKAEFQFTSARNHARVPLSVPVNITVTRGGSSEIIPARALDVSEGGVSTVIAGELRPLELVGLEFRLPDVGIPVRGKAWLRHQSALRCGLEFTGFSIQQRSLIRYWLQRFPQLTVSEPAMMSDFSAKPRSKTRKPASHRLPLLIVAGAAILLAGLLWWHWQGEWTSLENSLPSAQTSVADKPVQVPAAEMQKLLVHKVDPIYPENARQANLSGIVTLNAIVEADGAVSQVNALSGPAVLQQAAVDAVKWWRFNPYQISGHAVRVQTIVAVEFRP